MRLLTRFSDGTGAAAAEWQELQSPVLVVTLRFRMVEGFAPCRSFCLNVFSLRPPSERG